MDFDTPFFGLRKLFGKVAQEGSSGRFFGKVTQEGATTHTGGARERCEAHAEAMAGAVLG